MALFFWPYYDKPSRRCCNVADLKAGKGVKLMLWFNIWQWIVAHREMIINLIAIIMKA